MTRVARIAVHLIDPRGRCSRRGLLLAAAALLTLQAGVGGAFRLAGADFAGWHAWCVDAAFCWAGLAIVSKRLHDLGRSSWWLPTAALIWLAASVSLVAVIVLAADPDMLTPGTPTYGLLLAVMMAPLLVCAVWLHVAAGMAGRNRFGPEPDVSGFSAPERGLAWDCVTGTEPGVA